MLAPIRGDDAPEAARHVVVQENHLIRLLHDLVRWPDARQPGRLAAEHRVRIHLALRKVRDLVERLRLVLRAIGLHPHAGRWRRAGSGFAPADADRPILAFLGLDEVVAVAVFPRAIQVRMTRGDRAARDRAQRREHGKLHPTIRRTSVHVTPPQPAAAAFSAAGSEENWKTFPSGYVILMM